MTALTYLFINCMGPDMVSDIVLVRSQNDNLVKTLYSRGELHHEKHYSFLPVTTQSGLYILLRLLEATNLGLKK